jgi:uncharacterized protein (UPF0261 family)
VPERFRDRRLYEHNSSVTLMRTTADECAALGAELARKVAKSSGSATVFLPLRGVSAIAVEGGAFFDDAADPRLFEAVRTGLAGTGVRLVEMETDVNDPAFAAAMVEALHASIAR